MHARDGQLFDPLAFVCPLQSGPTRNYDDATTSRTRVSVNKACSPFSGDFISKRTKKEAFHRIEAIGIGLNRGRVERESVDTYKKQSNFLKYFIVNYFEIKIKI